MGRVIVKAGYILPVVPERQVLRHHALVFDDETGLIVDLAPNDAVEAKYPHSVVINKGECALLPGLVNAHSHAPMTLLRGYADDLELHPWLNDHIWPAEAVHVGPEFCHDGALLGFAEMLRCGTTMVNDAYFFPESIAEAAQLIGIRLGPGAIWRLPCGATVAAPILLFPAGNYVTTADEYFEKAVEFLEKYKNHRYIRPAIMPHAPYSVSDEQFRRIVDLAEKYDAKIHMHVHETEKEVTDALHAGGPRPIARLHDLGVITERLIAVHMTQLEEEEIALFARQRAAVVTCPESNAKLASGICPVQKLFNAGCTVGLGTDGAASNNDLDLFGEMRTAGLVGKLKAQSASAVDSHSIVRMATLGGARALGLGDQVGSLEVGKCADFFSLRLDDYVTHPMYDLASHIVYVLGRQYVTDVWVGGRHVITGGHVTTVPMAELRRRADHWADRLRAHKRTRSSLF